MTIGPCRTQSQAFWRTADELRHLMGNLREEFGQDPNLRAHLSKVEAMHSSLERKVQSLERPLQRVAGFP